MKIIGFILIGLQILFLFFDNPSMVFIGDPTIKEFIVYFLPCILGFIFLLKNKNTIIAIFLIILQIMFLEDGLPMLYGAGLSFRKTVLIFFPGIVSLFLLITRNKLKTPKNTSSKKQETNYKHLDVYADHPFGHYVPIFPFGHNDHDCDHDHHDCDHDHHDCDHDDCGCDCDD